MAFGAGVVGGLANSLVVWLFGIYGFTTRLGVGIAPALTLKWLYPRLVWGGIWGFLFLLPIFRNSIFKRGLLISLGPSIMQISYFFPYKAHAGYLGMGLGALTPVFVLLFNAVWGIMAALWLNYLKHA